MQQSEESKASLINPTQESKQAAKLTKKKKNAINNLDQMVL